MSTQSGFPLEQALLGFLMQGAAHGYALHQRAEGELGRIWYMGLGNVYNTLKSLEYAGKIETTLEPQENYPPRKVHQITPDGRDSFLSWLRKPVSAIRDMRVEFLAKLYFFHTLGLDGVDELLMAQKKLCQKQIESLKRNTVPPTDTFQNLVYEFRRRRIQSTLDWLQLCQDEWGTG